MHLFVDYRSFLPAARPAKPVFTSAYCDNSLFSRTYIYTEHGMAHMSGRNIWINFQAPQQYVMPGLSKLKKVVDLGGQCRGDSQRSLNTMKAYINE